MIFGEHIFEKRCNLHFFGILSKKSSNSWQYFPAESSKLHFKIPGEQCGCTLFPKKLTAHCFSGYWVKNFRSFRNNVSAGFVETAFFCVQRNFFEIKIFMEFANLYSYLGYELKIFGVWAKSFRRGCKNCILQVRG